MTYNILYLCAAACAANCQEKGCMQLRCVGVGWTMSSNEVYTEHNTHHLHVPSPHVHVMYPVTIQHPLELDNVMLVVAWPWWWIAINMP